MISRLLSCLCGLNIKPYHEEMRSLVVRFLFSSSPCCLSCFPFCPPGQVFQPAAGCCRPLFTVLFQLSKSDVGKWCSRNIHPSKYPAFPGPCRQKSKSFSFGRKYTNIKSWCLLRFLYARKNKIDKRNLSHLSDT